MKPCPECNDDLQDDATSCFCGWAASASRNNGPPNRYDELMAIVRDGSPSRLEPRDHGQAVNWYSALFEGPDGTWERPEEKSRLKRVNGQEQMVSWWRDPYIERMRCLVQAFRAADVQLQSYVVAAQEDGMPWRGEPLEQFKLVVSEYERMREMTREHGRDHAVAEMRKRAGRNLAEINREGGR